LKPLLAIMFATGRFAMILTALSDDLHAEADSEFRIPSTMTEEEFVEWSQTHEKVRVEWLNGEVLPMSPVSVRHVRLFVWLLNLLDMHSRRRKLGEVFGSEFVTRLQTPSGVSRRIPDIMFVARERLQLLRENHLEGAPDLAVEIVSPESVKRDWIEKRAEYESAGVREYRIIGFAEQQFEALELDQQGKLISMHNQPSGLFSSGVLPGLQFRIEWLWEESPPDPIEILKGLGVL
jgi:Uma2 family endonuclease